MHTKEYLQQRLDILKAAEEGITIQFEYNPGEWWDTAQTTQLYPEKKYRIKPTTVKYKRYLFKNNIGHYSVCTLNFATYNQLEAPNTYPTFVRWIDTDWQEVEV